MRTMVVMASMIALAGAAPARAQDAFVPARYVSGDPPTISAAAISGGEVFLEASIGMDGRVGTIRALRTTPPFTQMMIDAVAGWRFRPAREAAPVGSKVLVAGIFRPPSLMGPTLGDPPRDVAPGADDVAIPLSTVTPPYPPLGVADAVVVVEVRVGLTGNVVRATTVQSVPGFDEIALAAARQWSFRPARIHRLLEETFVYIVFAFRRPVTFPAVP